MQREHKRKAWVLLGMSSLLVAALVAYGLGLVWLFSAMAP